MCGLWDLPAPYCPQPGPDKKTIRYALNPHLREVAAANEAQAPKVAKVSTERAQDPVHSRVFELNAIDTGDNELSTKQEAKDLRALKEQYVDAICLKDIVYKMTQHDLS